MQDLIKVTTNTVGEQVVSARDLHKFLVSDSSRNEVGRDFSHWIKEKLEFGYQLGKDYTTIGFDYLGNIVEENGIAKNGESDNQIVRVHKRDYILTLSVAKEFAMTQNNDKGKEARRYFIECEKQLKQQSTPVLIEDVLIQQLQVIKAVRLEQEQIKAKQLEQDQRIALVEAKSITRPEYFTVMGYASLQNVKIGLTLAAQIGKKAKAICEEKGYNIDKIHDPRFGQVGCYPSDVLRKAFSETAF